MVAPSLGLRKATRQKTKIRIGLSGPSGSGKTYSALMLASGMADWEKIAVIDTENGSADLYSHLGGYSVIRLVAPFSPERYIQAIKECEDAGMEVIIIDSVSHEWDGKGGCLESNDLVGQTRFKGNNWAAWSVTTPRHQKFVEAIISSGCHLITTARSKTDTIQTEDKKIKKVGLKEIQREGWEYELTVNFTLDRDGNYATASKDRTEMFINGDPFKITEKTGKKILKWASEGVDPLPPPPKPEVDAVGAPIEQPSYQSFMERLNDAKDMQGKTKVYSEAKRWPWKIEEAKNISVCFINGYVTIHSLLLQGLPDKDGSKVFRADGITQVATIKYDDRGFAMPVPVTKTEDGGTPTVAQKPDSPAPSDGQVGNKPETSAGTTGKPTEGTTDPDPAATAPDNFEEKEGDGITKQQIKEIHVLSGKIKLPDTAYRGMMMEFCGVKSSKEMSSDQADRFIDFLCSEFKLERIYAPVPA